MKTSLTIVILTLLMSCNAIKKENKVFTISRIQQEKDGQTLFLKDNDNKIYTTVISIPNGNFIKVNEGDNIRIDIKEILDTDPPIILSKHIEILD